MARRSNTPPKIFLSYSHRDRAFGEYLVQHLRRAIGDPDSVWYDDGLGVGDTWSEKIMEKLAQCNTFIVILSPNALKSRWVKTEIHTAWNRHNKNKMFIMPIKYRECKIPTKLAFLNTVQSISFFVREDFDANFRKLLTALNVQTNENINSNAKNDMLLPTHIQNIDNTKLKGHIIKSNISYIFQCIEEAYANQDWYSVIKIAEALTKYYANFIPDTVVEMKTFAYLYKQSEAMSKERYALAQIHLKKALDSIQDSRLRLELLDAYVITLMEQGIRGEEVEAYIEEARHLAPQDVSWKELQSKLPLLNLAEERVVTAPINSQVFISKVTIFSIIPLIFFILPLFRHFIKKK